jgi:hypothetical protein
MQALLYAVTITHISYLPFECHINPLGQSADTCVSEQSSKCFWYVHMQVSAYKYLESSKAYIIYMICEGFMAI